MRKIGIKLPSNLGSNLAVKSDRFSSDMSIEEFIETFQIFMGVKELGGLANCTLKDYRDIMGYFVRYLEEERRINGIPWGNINIDLFRAFQYYMVKERKLKNSTVNIRLRYMKAYLNWLYEEGRLEHNLSKRLKLLKVEKSKVKILSDSEVRKMLKAPNKTTYRGLRTFVIMVLMLDCGSRVSETASIKVKDVDLKEGIVTIRGSEAKFKKYRELSVSNKTKNLLKQLIDISKTNGEEYVFLNSYDGGKISSDQVIRDFQRCYKEAGLECKGVHSWRHTFATNFIKNGGNAFTLQRIMGHSTMDMTKRYVYMENKTLKDHHRKSGL
ncbi:MAG: hypothetical protein B6227_02250 [Fusobacteriia bacterium 4572_74]|nr:MAG: hypothetical protein B6227_02250 [Fusobacteriia bacterium 4572_74]